MIPHKVNPELYRKHGKLMLVIFWGVIFACAMALWLVVRFAAK